MASGCGAQAHDPVRTSLKSRFLSGRFFVLHVSELDPDLGLDCLHRSGQGKEPRPVSVVDSIRTSSDSSLPLCKLEV